MTPKEIAKFERAVLRTAAKKQRDEQANRIKTMNGHEIVARFRDSRDCKVLPFVIICEDKHGHGYIVACWDGVSNQWHQGDYDIPTMAEALEQAKRRGAGEEVREFAGTATDSDHPYSMVDPK